MMQLLPFATYHINFASVNWHVRATWKAYVVRKKQVKSETYIYCMSTTVVPKKFTTTGIKIGMKFHKISSDASFPNRQQLTDVTWCLFLHKDILTTDSILLNLSPSHYALPYSNSHDDNYALCKNCTTKHMPYTFILSLDILVCLLYTAILSSRSLLQYVYKQTEGHGLV